MANDVLKTTPAYLPWATFISALDNLKTHGIPGTGILDKSLWDTQSGAIQGQIVIAFRFMGLIDEKNQVLPALQPLVQSNADERKALLRHIVEDKYHAVLKRDLLTISTGQLEEAIRDYGISGSTLERAIRFFVKACQELGIPISKRVSDKVRSNPVSRRARRTPNGSGKTREAGEEGAGANVTEIVPPSKRHWEEKLLEKFPTFDPSWPDEIKTKWFTSFERLMKADR